MIVKCRICDKEFNTKQLAHHLKAKHQIKYNDYLDKYWKDIPGYQPCEICETMIYVRNNKTCSKKCNSELLSRLGSGRVLPPRTEEHCHKISKKAKKRLSNPENHPMYGKTQSEKSKKKNSITHKKMYDNGWKPNEGKKRDLTARANMSEAALLRAQQPDYVNPMQDKTHTVEAIKLIFSHRKMNSIEKIVADLLTENGIEYYFQYFLNRDGICKSYDFKIKGKPILIEVDGDYWHGNPDTKYHWKNVEEVKENDKLKDKLAEENGFTLLRFWESDIKKNPENIFTYF